MDGKGGHAHPTSPTSSWEKSYAIPSTTGRNDTFGYYITNRNIEDDGDGNPTYTTTESNYAVWADNLAAKSVEEAQPMVQEITVASSNAN